MAAPAPDLEVAAMSDASETPVSPETNVANAASPCDVVCVAGLFDLAEQPHTLATEMRAAPFSMSERRGAKRARTADKPASTTADGAATHTLVARPEHYSAFHSSFAALWRDGHLCDVEVMVDSGERFSAHKLVLSSGSAFFRALFTSGMRDSTSAAVTVSEVAAPVMRSILTFLYEMQLEVSASTLSEVMRVASRLEVSALLTVSADFLIASLTPETVVASWHVALSLERPELDALRAACAKLAVERFDALAKQPDYSTLSAPQLKTLIASDELAGTEEEIFSSVRCWLGLQPAAVARAERLELLSLVRFPLMSPAFLAANVDPLLSSLEGGTALLLEAYRHKSLPNELRLQSPRTRPRVSMLPYGGGFERRPRGRWIEIEGCPPHVFVVR